MAHETEQYLLAKLSDGLKGPKLSQHSTFLKLRDLLKGKLSKSPTEDQSNLCKEKLYQLNNLLAEYNTVSKKHGLYTPYDYNLDRRLKKIKKELEGTAETSGGPSSHRVVTPPNGGEVSLPKKVEAFRWSSRSIGEKKVHGFEEEARSLERLLVCPEKAGQFNAVGIVGMGGIGKTTLCQLVFNNPEVKKHFLPRIWVCMSKQPNEDNDNKKEIVKRMLRCLGVEEEIIKSAEENHDLGGLIFALHLQLRGKKYLIVLDDAWNKDGCFGKLDSELTRDVKWDEKLAYGLPKGCGGTVVVTSRSEEVAKSMVGENLRRLLPISDEEICWQIFEDSVKKEGIEFPPDQEQLKREILKKCNGLPLAAKMMGQIMHEQLQKKLNSNQSPPNQNHLASQLTNNLVV